jgi:hypothetical protein
MLEGEHGKIHWPPVKILSKARPYERASGKNDARENGKGHCPENIVPGKVKVG